MSKFNFKKKIPFIYFILLTPVLAKILEWTAQIILWGKDIFFLYFNNPWVFIMQILFLEAISFLTFLVFDFKGKTKVKYLLFVPAIAYFLKEVYNFSLRNIINGAPITFGYVQLIALTIEPLIVLFLLGYLPYKMFFKKK